MSCKLLSGLTEKGSFPKCWPFIMSADGCFTSCASCLLQLWIQTSSLWFVHSWFSCCSGGIAGACFLFVLYTNVCKHTLWMMELSFLTICFISYAVMSFYRGALLCCKSLGAWWRSSFHTEHSFQDNPFSRPCSLIDFSLRRFYYLLSLITIEKKQNCMQHIKRREEFMAFKQDAAHLPILRVSMDSFFKKYPNCMYWYYTIFIPLIPAFWSKHYPQCNSVTDSSVKDSGMLYQQWLM